ncbi:TIGR01244 family sulfur transferase [Devosia sp.]|uniref:TIGR01244 family sulfur transferase n=1 Tax=Devosia sp. TaxID=1871048 RepID=UPI0025C3D848|nr:TIGR01244 family sulfur transferase [Devosia sp.]
MWPFSSSTEPKDKKVNFKNLDKDYAVSGQILPAQIPAIAAAGFKSIVCARPDNEDHGQPSFDEVAREAEKAGLQIVHVPVSGMVGQGAFMKFEQAMEQMPKPVLAYCRSGGRAASLYTMLKRA